MISVGLAVLFVVNLGGAQALPVIPPEGASLPERVEIEWLGPDSRSQALDTRPVTNRMVLLPIPPANAESVRVIGPDVVSQPVLLKDRQAGIRLSRAGKLRLTGLPPGVTGARIFARLEGSDLEFSRELQTKREPQVEFAFPLGTFSAVLDLGPDRVPILIPSIIISARSVTVIKTKESNGRPLVVDVVTKEDRKPLRGASITGKATADLPPLFWRALAERCGVSDPAGVLSCGLVPLSLHTFDVVAARRRWGRVSVALPTPDKDPKQPLQIVLAHFQSVAVSSVLIDDDHASRLKRLTAVLVRCERTPCDDSKAERKEFGYGQRVNFPQMEPGLYRTWLEGPSLRSSTTPVLVSADSEAPDTMVVSLQFRPWRIVGSAHLTDGVGVPATIKFGILQENEHQEEAAGSVKTDSTGAYETELLVPAGAYIRGHAVSETPPAEGETDPPGIKLEGIERTILDVELSTAGGVVKLVDKETREPIPACDVAFFYFGGAKGGVRGLKSDASGVVHWLGISKGTYVARATCDGYRPASTDKVELSASSDATILELEPAGGILVRVRDANNDPLPGALVFLEQSTFENVTFPFQIPAEQLGATDFNGEISVPARPRPGFYVVAAGYSLYVARLAPCPIKAGCVGDVFMTRPSAFPGIRVRNVDGQPQSAAWLVFSKDGVPIPVSIQTEVLRINQADPGQYNIISEGFDTIHMLPWFFGPGIYDVEYTRTRPGTPPERIPLARMSLPATRRIELTLPPPPPPS